MALIGAEVPRQSPEYALDVAGRPAELLSKYKGKVVVMEFLFTTCPHCQKSATILSKLQREYGPKGFQAIGVAINPNPDLAGFATSVCDGFHCGSGTRESAIPVSFSSRSCRRISMCHRWYSSIRKGVIRAQYGGNDPFLGDQQEANMRGHDREAAGGTGGRSAKPARKAKPAKKDRKR